MKQGRIRPVGNAWFYHSDVWVWSAVALSILICFMVAWLHVQEKETLRHFLADLNNIRQAQLDLSKGFLHLSLAEEKDSPFSAAKGGQLLQQAVVSFGETVARLDCLDEGVVAAFRKSMKAFEEKLAAWQACAPTLRSQHEVELRVMYSELERQARRIDEQTQFHLARHSAHLDEHFVVSLVIAGLLLTVICILVLHAGKTKDRFEAASQANAERFREAMEVTQDGLWDWNIQKDELYQSPSCWRMLEHVEEDTPEMRVISFDLIHPDERETVRAACIACLKNERQSFENEFRVRTKKGSWKWILGRGKVVCRDDTGRALRMIGTNVDITRRKMAEEAQRTSEEQIHAMFQVVNVGIVLADPRDGQMLRVNQRYCDITGYSAEELIKVRFPELTHPEDRERDWYLFSKAINGEASGYQNEKRYIRKDGGIVWVHISSSFIRDKNGKAFLSVAICEDITLRKRAEAEREKLQEQLLQAQKMESVGRLAGGVAHDFNNMLSVVIGHADLIRERLGVDNPYSDNVEEIRKAAIRAGNLTKQLLAFARKQTIAPRVLDLNETVSSMLKMLQRLMGEDIDLVWVPAEKLSAVRIDPSQVDQLLANLCVNARDAIEDVGKITIETRNAVFDEEYCRVHADYVPGDYVLLAVSDNGCGMSDETRKKIFEPFFTTKGMGKGTGLGLATVYGIIRQNGGFINVYSEPGKGTTFKLYLPRCEEHPVPSSVPDDLFVPKGQGETILLVENDLALLRLTTSMLLMEGYVVLVADNPTKALRLAKEYAETIDLLMTDVVMPDMNGRELAAKIFPLRPGIKCLYMSGYTANVIAHHGVLDASVNFIPKPFSKREMSAKVYAVLHSGGTNGSAG